MLPLRTLTVKHVAAFLKSNYLWRHNYSLDMLLLHTMNLDSHLNLHIAYTDRLGKTVKRKRRKKTGLVPCQSDEEGRGKPSGCKKLQCLSML